MNKLPKFKVIGIGGSGVNAITRMSKHKIENVELIAINTDAQSLQKCPVKHKILIGKKTTKGLGTGMDVRLGEKAARESYEELKQAVIGADMIFLACGMGGGSGTSGIPILGEISKNLGILTIATVTLPFSFEGSQRKNIAKTGLKKLKNNIDSLLVIPNDKLLHLIEQNTTVENAFWMCDDVLREAVKGISDLISSPGIINVDFADLKAILKNSGQAFMGLGKAKGERRAFAAASSALQSPLLDFDVKKAQGILFNIAGKNDLTLNEVNLAAVFIKKATMPGVKIIFGVSEDNSLKHGEIKITLMATSKN